ncbi:hypothetical protein EJM73_06545 [Clostridium botulinum]|uniref:hypothetical protein n=1 Tax=Clostridium botulinum TaxID=1491 RepID=UPI001375ABF9|nr:hypothetical protein [Clostridium botulinum]NCI20616.1 hypothetical protein [Clostridium botulinum]NCI35325.1 hypothetical protein [Clostridium botulinum]NCI72083.1 hypothetical protein [Clostridium botulinum]NDI38196.1 hypothetical protein [Clostridium botulinum]
MNNEIEILYDEIFNLEKWLELNIPVLKKCVENMDASLVNTYINIVFNFYDNGYNLSQYSQECPYLDEILCDYEEFISAYSKLIKFYTCFQIKIPVGVDDYFFKWKRARDVVQKLKRNIDKILREDEDIISEEREETLRVIKSCDDDFLLSGINTILKTIVNNEERIREIDKICYNLYGEKDLIKKLDSES